MNEATINSSLRIRVGNLNYQSQPTSYVANVVSVNGPTPGAITVPSTGIDIDLSHLTALGGLCWIANLSSVYSVKYGIRDTVTGVSYTPFKLMPGEFAVIRLDEDLHKQEAGTGTFTGATVQLHMKTDGGGSAVVRVDAFDP